MIYALFMYFSRQNFPEVKTRTYNRLRLVNARNSFILWLNSGRIYSGLLLRDLPEVINIGNIMLVGEKPTSPLDFCMDATKGYHLRVFCTGKTMQLYDVE